MKDQLKKMDLLSRREFAAKTAFAAFGVGLYPTLDQAIAARGVGGKAKHLIYFYMGGGMTHIDSFDPKPDASSDIRGPIGSISTNVDGIRVGSYFKGLAKRADKLAIVNTLTQKTGDHQGGRYWMLTGYQQRATIVHPEIGAWIQKFHGTNQQSDLPTSFAVGGGAQPGAGFFGPAYSPLPIRDPSKGLANAKPPENMSSTRQSKRLDALETFNRAFESKFATEDVAAYTEYYDNTMSFLQSEDLDVFDLGKESQSERGKFGNSRMGQGALLAARLVEKGAKYVRVNGGGCDNHQNIQTAFQGPATSLDTAFSALLDRLEASGKLDETLIVVGTEFGRTPGVNKNAGRDHFPRCFSGVMAGGGIVGGQVYGKSDAKGYAPAENPVSPVDYNATIAMALGMPLDEIIFAPSGRPFLVAGHKHDPKTHAIIPEGNPIMPFFG
ncbi:MAG: DUF1501 domain-containing protein [Verrucomicrobiota bacterium]